MKQKVLLVDDDNESLLRSLGNSFSAESFEVVLAEDVEQAIEKSEAGEIELLLMKLDLQSSEGWNAILEITEENPFLPIVVVTSQPGLRTFAKAAGACALVEEPIDVPVLLQTIRDLLAEPVQRRMERFFNRTTNFQKASPSSGVFRATGSSVPGRVLFGSTANEVLHQATCAVLVIPCTDEPEFEPTLWRAGDKTAGRQMLVPPA